MELRLHDLDQWLQQHTEHPIAFDLGSSTGPHWKLRDLLALAGEGSIEHLLDTELTYSRSAGGTSLREAIAQMHGVPADHVLVMAGAAEALLHLFFIAAEPGANAIVPFPCFPPYQTMPESLGIELRPYHLRRENAYRIDLAEVERLADSNTRILMVNLPHNPTGATLSDAEMRWLHDFAADRGIQFVSDEVHHPIYHGPNMASAARLAHATTIGDFSKAFSLPGLRLGWIIEPDARRRSRYLNAREHVTISNTPVSELLAEIAVRHRDTLWGRAREIASANLKLLDRLISDYPDAIAWVRPQGGMTAFPWLVSGANARELCQAAARQGLLLVPGDCFGCPEHIRIGFGVSSEWFPRAVARLAGLLESRGLSRRAG